MSTAEEIKGAKRQLAIKTGVLKRLSAEVKSYVKEADEQRATAQRLAGKEGADQWDVQNANKVLADCEQMIEPSRHRAREARHQLSDLLAVSQSEPELLGSDEYKRAQEMLAARDSL